MLQLAFFATVPKGMEPLLVRELEELGAVEVRPVPSGVSFTGSLETAYRACLWSRTASRILSPLAVIPAATTDDLYWGIHDLPWEDHLTPDGTLAVNFTLGGGGGGGITHTQFGAQRVKDAMVDRFRERFGRRPSVDLQQPDLRVNVHLDGELAEVRLDLSGEALHRRGYRSEALLAPLKENLAAAILLKAGWPEMAAGGCPFLDPMCGSGTLCIEAALMAGDIAPGLLRSSFGFLRWPHHDAAIWEALLAEARERREAGRSRIPPIMGSDADPRAVRAARTNLQQARLQPFIIIDKRDLAQVQAPAGVPGLLAVNPPYGERLGDETGLRPLYETLGHVLRERFIGWRAAVFTGNPGLVMRLGIRARRRHTLYNGALKCALFTIEVTPERFMQPSREPAAGASPGAAQSPMLANRLRKNLKNIGGWARREGIGCYRLYDADLPEYAVALDLYTEMDSAAMWAVAQEYEAPKTVDPDKATERLGEALATIPGPLGIPPERLVLKVRRRQRGTAQYEKQADEGLFHTVAEGGLSFLVNFTDYLDTGLFLDHRLTRAMLHEMARGRSFLNLFCYTGAATVYAAAGGAAATVSVDLSNTYLDWARRNLAANGFAGAQHELARADCREWLKAEKRRFGLIFLDPPSFSTSKGMEGTLDIQRDHGELIRDAARLLEPEGTLVFSTNLRKFKLDREALSGLSAEDITGRTIPKDFERNPRIHACWLLRRAPGGTGN